jgi:hypothetical protein
LAEVEKDGKKLRAFSMVAYTGSSMIVPGYFRPLVVDLAGLNAASQRLPVLRDHEPKDIVAHTEFIEISAQRVKTGGVMSGVGDAAVEVLNLASNNFPWQVSIGAQIHAKEFVDQGQTVKVNGRNLDGPIIVARKATLRELSFVSLGADPGTSATVAAGMGDNDMAFTEWLTKKGFEPDKLTDVQRTTLEASWKTENAPPTDPPPDRKRAKAGSVADRAEAARQRERAEEHIEAKLTTALEDRRINSSDFDELRAEAFADPDKWDDNRLELEFIRRERPKGPGVSYNREAQVTDEVIECAVAMAASLSRVDKYYQPAVCEMARKRWKSGLSMGELAVMAAHRNGYRGFSIRGNLREVLQTAVLPNVRAAASGPSTYSIPNILSNVANKFALEGFYSVDQTWSSIASRRSVNDFKQITSLRPTGDLMFTRTAPGGEIEHGSIGELPYTNQAHTYAKIIGINREDWINDDTGALGGTAREMGVGGADAINHRFWTIFLNNATFFVAGNNNVSTGALSLASVAAADSVFRLQTKPNGRPLGLVPSLLLVPTALRITALNIVNSTTVVASTTANTALPASNVLQGAYTVLSSPFLGNTLYTGNSAIAFYMLASPGQISTIEGVFLNGVETPVVETADFDWNTLGTSMRGYLDFGFAMQEYRGGVRSTGA